MLPSTYESPSSFQALFCFVNKDICIWFFSIPPDSTSAQRLATRLFAMLFFSRDKKNGETLHILFIYDLGRWVIDF